VGAGRDGGPPGGWGGERGLGCVTGVGGPGVGWEARGLDAAHRYREYLVDSRVHTPVREWLRLDARIELVSTNIRVVRMQLAACIEAT